MEMRIMTPDAINGYERQLVMAERAKGTIEKYLRDVTRFARWADGKEITRALTVQWKEKLCQEGYSPRTVNSMLASIHGFFRYKGWEECRVHFLRVQRQMFRDQSRELTKEEYERLLAAARTGKKERLALLLETICGTGIRVSELRYLTVEALEQKQARITLKGKIRTILLPDKLVRKLKRFAGQEGIRSGELFLTKNGTGISRKQIWAEMKALCAGAGVEETKVFPHNLRHLFARTFYEVSKDVVRLADVLGHSNIETTRIYLLTTGEEYRFWLDGMRLVC